MGVGFSPSAQTPERRGNTFTYDPVGNRIILENAAGGSTTNVFRWVGALGYYYDLDRLAYDLRARTYSPQLARFLSRDPIGFRGSKWNLYEYVGGKPTRYVDPFGLQHGTIPLPVPPNDVIDWDPTLDWEIQLLFFNLSRDTAIKNFCHSLEERYIAYDRLYRMIYLLDAITGTSQRPKDPETCEEKRNRCYGNVGTVWASCVTLCRRNWFIWNYNECVADCNADEKRAYDGCDVRYELCLKDENPTEWYNRFGIHKEIRERQFWESFRLSLELLKEEKKCPPSCIR